MISGISVHAEHHGVAAGIFHAGVDTPKVGDLLKVGDRLGLEDAAHQLVRKNVRGYSTKSLPTANVTSPSASTVINSIP